MIRPVRAISGLLAAGLLAAACGGAPARSASPVPTRSAAPTVEPILEPADRIACDLINAGTAAEFIGAPVFDARPSDRGDGSACLFAATDGGAGTVGVTLGAPTVSESVLVTLAQSVPEATAVPGNEQVLVARGAAWFVLDHHLVSVVLVDVDGRPGSPDRMRDLVRAILAGA